MERKYYFILRSLVTKYGKDNVINTVNNRLLALLVKKLQIFVKKILIEKYNFN
ncbi:hypothetical protein [Spiroplasma poulsonii]|uniref:hypothetical protein n=1 Tax=Spiroplasma poulsonii TaxID=2138 RepID=UPI0018F4F1BC|nr:hypothetical protein [Spiroplasma poulsonii]